MNTATRSLSTLALLLLLCAGSLHAQTLRGSRASVDRVYDQARGEELYFFRTGSGVREAAREGTLVRLRGNANYTLAGVSYPYVRPVTRTFVERLASQYRSACGERLVVTSATRPQSMRLFNSSPKTVHPTGTAVDLRTSRRASCRNWLRNTLLALERQKVVEATEERRPAHFHVAVFPGPYQEYVSGRRQVPVRRVIAARQYRVRTGDTLWSIARRHDTTVSRLKELNDLRSSRLRPGQVLVVPG